MVAVLGSPDAALGAPDDEHALAASTAATGMRAASSLIRIACIS
jgi:hypothetical protein